MSTGIIALIVTLIALVVLLLIYALDQKKKYEDAKRAFFNKSEQLAEFRRHVNRVLWNIGNQSEKVEDSVIHLSEKYRMYGHDTSRVMARKIKERLK